MNKEFIPYEQALDLKELGFDEPCFGWYSKDGTFYEGKMTIHQGLLCAPTFSQVFRWFREKYPDLDFGVAKIHNGTNNYHYHINLQWEFFEGTYEEAELACLLKLIEIVKQ
jgi:hypothetical protein